MEYNYFLGRFKYHLAVLQKNHDEQLQSTSKEHKIATYSMISNLISDLTSTSSLLKLPDISSQDTYLSVALAAEKVFIKLEASEKKMIAELFSLRDPKLTILHSMPGTDTFATSFPETFSKVHNFLQKVKKYYFEDYDTRITALFSKRLSKSDFDIIFTETLPFMCYTLPSVMEYNDIQLKGNEYYFVYDRVTLANVFLKINPPESWKLIFGIEYPDAAPLTLSIPAESPDSARLTS